MNPPSSRVQLNIYFLSRHVPIRVAAIISMKDWRESRRIRLRRPIYLASTKPHCSDGILVESGSALWLDAAFAPIRPQLSTGLLSRAAYLHYSNIDSSSSLWCLFPLWVPVCEWVSVWVYEDPPSALPAVAFFQLLYLIHLISFHSVLFHFVSLFFVSFHLFSPN